MYVCLPNSRGDRSNGGPVDCTSSPNHDPLRCITTDTPANLTLYRPLGQIKVQSDNRILL